MTKRKVKGRPRKANPLMRMVPRVPRPKVSFDGQVLNSNLYQGHSAVALGFGKDFFYVGGGASSVSKAATQITDRYNEYKYRSVQFEWIPSISPASAEAGGRIHIAIVDNPEKMVAFEAAVPGTVVNLIRGVKNVKTFNIWERFSCSFPLTYRRKLFDIDTTSGAMTADIADRTMQGQIQIAMETVGPTFALGTLGTYKFTYSMELHGLTLTQLT